MSVNGKPNFMIIGPAFRGYPQENKHNYLTKPISVAVHDSLLKPIALIDLVKSVTKIVKELG